MARSTFVKKARKDIPGTNIKAGESYYWWKFRYGGKRYSKTPPKPSQLTSSDFLSTIYSHQEDIAALDAKDFTEPEDLHTWKEDLVSQLEELRDEQESKKDNMPEGLQEGPTGQLLQERYDELDSMISELEGVDTEDFDFDEDPAKDDLESENDELEEENKLNEDQIQDEVNKKRDEAVNEWLDEKIGELQGVSYNGN